MTLFQLQVFLAVVENGSFTKAGELLNISQSGVSHTISGLETELGVSLLTRNRKGISLTESGEQILPHIREIINQTEQIKQLAAAAKGLQIGTLRIGSFPSVSAKLLPTIIQSFRQRYPGIELVLFEGTYEEISGWIMAGAVDIGFLTCPCEGLETVSLVTDELVALLPAGHPLTNQPQLTLEQLASEPFIMPKAGCEQLLKAAFHAAKITPDIQFEVADNATILSMVQSGIGISIVPRLILPDESTRLGIVPLANPLHREIGLAFRSLDSAAPATLAFIRAAQDSVKL